MLVLFASFLEERRSIAFTFHDSIAGVRHGWSNRDGRPSARILARLGKVQFKQLGNLNLKLSFIHETQ
jgi:hypothetical protein